MLTVSNAARNVRWGMTAIAAAAISLMLADPVAGQEVEERRPAPSVFVVGDDDALDGTGIALTDPVLVGAGEEADRHFAVVGMDTDRQILLAADGLGPLIDHPVGLAVSVASCPLPRDADLAGFGCPDWVTHYDGRVADLGEIATGIAPADRGRFVRVRLSLPADAPDELQDEATTLTYTLSAEDPTWTSPEDGAPPDDGPPPEEGATESGRPPGPLPRTGNDVWGAILVAAALVTIGTATLTRARKREVGGPMSASLGGAVPSFTAHDPDEPVLGRR